LIIGGAIEKQNQPVYTVTVGSTLNIPPTEVMFNVSKYRIYFIILGALSYLYSDFYKLIALTFWIDLIFYRL
jgi:hypothetical protein